MRPLSAIALRGCWLDEVTLHHCEVGQATLTNCRLEGSRVTFPGGESPTSLKGSTYDDQTDWPGIDLDALGAVRSTA